MTSISCGLEPAILSRDTGQQTPCFDRCQLIILRFSTLSTRQTKASCLSFVISYFPYFKLVTLKTLVILCNTLKKEGRAFRNIGKNISLYCITSLANFRLLCPYQPIIWRMAAILRDSVVVVVVVRTRPRAIPLAMITMRKSLHGLPLVSYMGMGLRLAALRAAGAPL